MPRSSDIQSDPDILGGTPLFVGTRVPLKNLVDYLSAGHTLDHDFPWVTREQVVAALEEGTEVLIERGRPAR